MQKLRIRNILSGCLLVLFIAFQTSFTAFSHVHILNGERLVHSHPYSNSNHNHSVGQIITLARLSSFQSLENPTIYVGDAILPELYQLEFEDIVLSASEAHLNLIRLRGPPVC